MLLVLKGPMSLMLYDQIRFDIGHILSVATILIFVKDYIIVLGILAILPHVFNNLLKDHGCLSVTVHIMCLFEIDILMCVFLLSKKTCTR